MLSSWYPTRDSEFTGNFVQRQAHLLSSDFQITVLHTKSDSSIQEFEICENTNGNFREIIVYHPKRKNLFQKYRIQNQALKKGLKLIDDVDLVHGHILLPKGLQFISAKKYFKCPLMITEHGSYFRTEAKRKRNFLETFILKKIKKHVDKLTAVSEFLKADLQADFPQHAIHILPNHVDTDKFIPKEKEIFKRKEFLHISTLDENIKDPKGIIDACKTLVQKGESDFHLTIISDEPTDKWRKYALENQLLNFVTFLGPLKWFDLIPYYQNSDAFILFSNYETFSIVLAEAWSCGIPIITTSVGIGNKLSSDLGIQVKINDSESLANAMHEFIRENKKIDPKLIRSHAEQFSGEKIISTFEELIKDLT